MLDFTHRCHTSNTRCVMCTRLYSAFIVVSQCLLSFIHFVMCDQTTSHEQQYIISKLSLKMQNMQGMKKVLLNKDRLNMKAAEKGNLCDNVHIWLVRHCGSWSPHVSTSIRNLSEKAQVVLADQLQFLHSTSGFTIATEALMCSYIFEKVHMINGGRIFSINPSWDGRNMSYSCKRKILTLHRTQGVCCGLFI